MDRQPCCSDKGRPCFGVHDLCGVGFGVDSHEVTVNGLNRPKIICVIRDAVERVGGDRANGAVVSDGSGAQDPMSDVMGLLFVQ